VAVSILHRATGVALSFAGLGLLTWWLIALSGDAADYGTFQAVVAWLTGGLFAKAETAVQMAVNVLGIVIGVGLTWSFFQHLLSGIRHLVTDSGAAFELGINKSSAIMTMVGSVLLTILLWAWLLGVRP
jgi:succinate dehydrogenase / fumarate reductase cytochrome b subunit